jgi:hypothetical protein
VSDLDAAADGERPLTRSGRDAKSSNMAALPGASAASRRFMSTSRSPGTPIASNSSSPPGWCTVTITFFSVSAAVQSVRPSRARALARSTSEAMVGVSGVSWTASSAVTSGPGAGAGVSTASVFAAYEHVSHPTNVSSPTGAVARNSSEADPPMAPDVAATIA